MKRRARRLLILVSAKPKWSGDAPNNHGNEHKHFHGFQREHLQHEKSGRHDGSGESR